MTDSRKRFVYYLLFCGVNLLLTACGFPIWLIEFAFVGKSGAFWVTKVWSWVFAFPLMAFGMSAVESPCCLWPLNSLVVGGMWYGAWRWYAWLFRRRAKVEGEG